MLFEHVGATRGNAERCREQNSTFPRCAAKDSNVKRIEDMILNYVHRQLAHYDCLARPYDCCKSAEGATCYPSGKVSSTLLRRPEPILGVAKENARRLQKTDAECNCKAVDVIGYL